MEYKWNADIIRDTTCNRYRAIITFDYRPEVDIEGNGWKDLVSAVRRATGICFPMKKYFQFSKLSDWEQIAGIDASHVRATCIVTRADRKNGWMRYKTW